MEALSGKILGANFLETRKKMVVNNYHHQLYKINESRCSGMIDKMDGFSFLTFVGNLQKFTFCRRRY